MQCGCCGARLYWHSKSNQWFCRECGMWSKPTQAKETFNSIVEKLRWLQQNSELIHPPAGKANVQSMEIVLLDREIGQVLLDAEPDADALITKILDRAEREYEFCSAGDADPATMQIRKACAGISRQMASRIPFIRRSSARSSCTVTPISNSNCGTDKLCKGKSHEQHENH